LIIEGPELIRIPDAIARAGGKIRKLIEAEGLSKGFSSSRQ